jgi:hypothetical protein
MSKSADASNEPAASAFTSQRKICRLCVHYRMRSATVLFSAGELAAPGVLKALNQWDQQRAQRAFQEEQRLLNRQPFDYEPHHYPWCAFYTKQEGGVSVNPVTGDVSQLYILCAWKNEYEDCSEFTGSDRV